MRKNINAISNADMCVVFAAGLSPTHAGKLRFAPLRIVAPAKLPAAKLRRLRR